jgi:hypothetical protein
LALSVVVPQEVIYGRGVGSISASQQSAFQPKRMTTRGHPYNCNGTTELK